MSNKLRSYVVKIITTFTIVLILLKLILSVEVSDLKILSLSFVIANFLYFLLASLTKMKIVKKIRLVIIEVRNKIFISGETKFSTTKNDFFNENINNPDNLYNTNLFDNNNYLINPASGLPMIDNSLDINGNMYGTNNQE